MFKLFASALAVLIMGAAVPGNAAQEVSPRKMIDPSCTIYREGVVVKPKSSYMTRGDQARLTAEASMLRLGRAIHSDMNTYYQQMTRGKGEAPALNLYRVSKRLGNKGCPAPVR